MSTVTYSIGEDYWENFALEEEDIEFLYNHLLEIETPLTSQELLAALVEERIRRQRLEIERKRTSGGELYQPKKTFSEKQKLIFPALGWKRGEVIGIRDGQNPDLGEFQVIQIAFGDGSQREFAGTSNIVAVALGDRGKSGQIAVMVKQQVQLYRSLGGSEFGPGEKRQAKRYDG